MKFLLIHIGRYKVIFFGTCQTGTLKAESMWPFNPVTKAKMVLKNLKKIGFMEALDQMENTPEIVAVEGVGEVVVVPEVTSLEMLEVKIPEVGARERGDVYAVAAVERGEEEVEVPEVEASSKTMEHGSVKPVQDASPAVPKAFKTPSRLESLLCCSSFNIYVQACK